MILKSVAFLLLFYQVNCEGDLLEGANCTIDGHPGTCVKLDQCQWALKEQLEEDKEPQICSTLDTIPIVCCTDCKDLLNLTLFVQNPASQFLLKTGQKAWDMCLNYLRDLPYPCKAHINYGTKKDWDFKNECHNIQIYALLPTGGEDAERGQFPHMALLGYGKDEDSAEWLCGGTLISDRFILTAGHCISSPLLGNVSYVALGILKRTDPPSTWKKYKVKRVIKHPDYKPPIKYHDIALLETETPITFEEATLPACLHLGDDNENYDEKAIATGWGALRNRGDLADNLQTVTLQKFTEEQCRNTYPKHRTLKHGYNHSTQMCYGDPDAPKDTCEGDSGGPLQIDNYKGLTCIHTIIGVTSFGRACGVSAQPGIYSRVAHYLPWIESVVWP